MGVDRPEFDQRARRRLVIGFEDECADQLTQCLACPLIKAANNPEVQEHNSSVRIHHEVPRMQIAMEGAGSERGIEQCEHQGLHHFGTVEPRVPNRVRVVNPDALDILHGEHLVGAEVRIEFGDTHLRRIPGAREPSGPISHGPSFQAEIQFLGEVRLKVPHHLIDVRHPAHLGQFETPGDLFENL